MSTNRISIEQRLNLANIAINNALNEPSLAAMLAGFGYTAERLRQGGALRENALALYQRQKSAYGDLQTANDAYAAAQAQAQETYMRYVKVARVALEEERGALQKLSLASRRKRAQSGQLAQAQQFYANALADTAILDKLAAFGITRVMLGVGQQQLDAVAQGDAVRRQRQGAAQDATRARDVALAALANWMRDFMQIARVALRDRPQLLEMLGMSSKAARPAARPPASSAASVETSVVASVALLADSRSLTVEDHVVRSTAAKRNGTKLAAVSE